MKEIHLGYEIGTGKAVAIPVRHLAVTGQTQESGKTTTLEALVERSGLRAVAFVTKRAEGAFQSGRRIPAYFRERADWQFVSAVLEATFREKMRFERAWIMRACKGAKTLADVQRNVRIAITDPKVRGLSADVYMTLDEYLKVVVPQIERLKYSDALELAPGLNIMDLTAYSTELQALVVRSVLEWVYERERDTVTIIPEAWEFLPEGRGSPVLHAAEALIRKSAAAGNYVWLDSQDIAGVRKVILKSVIVWLIGVQREANEVKRALAHIPAGTPKPTTAEVMALGRGEFIACWGRQVKRVYVQPAWMEGDDARYAALGDLGPVPQRVVLRVSFPEEEDDDVDKAEREIYEAEIRGLKGDLGEARVREESLSAEIDRLKGRIREYGEVERAIAALRTVLAKGVVATPNGAVDQEQLIAEVIRRIPGAASGVVYQVSPVEKLRKDYQTAEVGRILEAISTFNGIQKDVLALLEMTDGPMSQEKIALRLGKRPGGWLAQLLKPMKNQGFIEVIERVGARKRLRAKISEDLAHYGASEEEIEATYQQVMAQVAAAGVRV